MHAFICLIACLLSTAVIAAEDGDLLHISQVPATVRTTIEREVAREGAHARVDITEGLNDCEIVWHAQVTSLSHSRRFTVSRSGAMSAT